MRWWIKLIVGLLAVVSLLWLLVQISGFTLNILSANRGEISVRDPQFAEEAETVTQPPDLWEEETQFEFKDNSANWDTSVLTPVEQTAVELGEEARIHGTN